MKPKQYHREYYLKHREQIKERSRLWRIKNREYNKMYSKQYYQKKRQEKQNQTTSTYEPSNLQTGKHNRLMLWFRRLFRLANQD